jgi:hypothetical protein
VLGIKWTLANGDKLEFANTWDESGTYEAEQQMNGKVVGIVFDTASTTDAAGNIVANSRKGLGFMLYYDCQPKYTYYHLKRDVTEFASLNVPIFYHETYADYVTNCLAVDQITDVELQTWVTFNSMSF